MIMVEKISACEHVKINSNSTWLNSKQYMRMQRSFCDLGEPFCFTAKSSICSWALIVVRDENMLYHSVPYPNPQGSTCPHTFQMKHEEKHSCKHI